ncbi:hypothetical protein PR003_g28221 [Phytophthora rubi]|uniref:Uncharacterized protein n=1 Tax=Phytophthora rubi TaxID=129364 RepID=A0A6A3HI62_9STRA|nr:hypothetical protein PR002_g27329 [Phytophthora rubi]KAE9279487.1 hypothetical protein PR003_g28221 [Phytophthora rubi]
MRGKCAFADCLVGDDEELAVTACTSCKNPVHYMCSNAVHEGALDIRVCSHRCAEALGLTNQQSSSNAAPTSRVAP